MDKKAHDITICEEMIGDIKHCLERTKDSWIPFIDLWPFTLRHIVDEWERKEQNVQN